MNEDQDLNTDQNLGVQTETIKSDGIPQHEVNALIGGAKAKAKQQGFQEGYMQAKNELMPQQQSFQPSQPVSNVPTQPQSGGMGGMPGLNAEDARKIAAEEFAKREQELQKQYTDNYNRQQGEKTASELSDKFALAKSRIPDFDNVVKPEDFSAIPDILHLANSVDNAGDVMYDIVKRPEMIGILRNMPHTFAQRKIKDLSDSIKQNQLASAQPQSGEPLSQLKPSTNGVGATKTGYSGRYKGMY